MLLGGQFCTAIAAALPRPAGIVVFATGFGGVVVGFFLVFNAGPLTGERRLFVPYGSTPSQIATILKDKGVVAGETPFTTAMRLLGGIVTLKAGEYVFEPRTSLYQIIGKLADGDVSLRQLTVPEGLTGHQIVEILKVNDALTGDIADIPAEGSLLPDTYFFEYKTPRQAIINRMQREMSRVVDELWEARRPDLPLETKGAICDSGVDCRKGNRA